MLICDNFDIHKIALFKADEANVASKNLVTNEIKMPAHMRIGSLSEESFTMK